MRESRRDYHDVVVRVMVVIALVVALVVLIAIFGRFVWFGLYFDRDYGAIGLGELSHDTHIVFPNSTRVIHARNQSFQDSFYWAKLEISPRDIGKLVQSLPKPRKVSQSDRLGLTNHSYGQGRWWDPDSVRRFQAVRAKADHGKTTVQVLVGMDDPKRPIVYLVWISGD